MAEAQSPHARMLDLTYETLVIHRAIYAAAVLRIPDLIAKGMRWSDEIAKAADSDPDATYRLMRTLASAGVLSESEDQQFSLTELGATLRSDIAGSMRGWVLVEAVPVGAYP